MQHIVIDMTSIISLFTMNIHTCTESRYVTSKNVHGTNTERHTKNITNINLFMFVYHFYKDL